MIVEKCIECIDARGLSQSGIYREAGAASNSADLKKRFFSASPPNLRTVADIRDVAGCLKLFLRDIDSPLLTFELYEAFVKGAKMSKDTDYSLVAGAIRRLPQVNFYTLYAVVRHLRRYVSPNCADEMLIV